MVKLILEPGHLENVYRLVDDMFEHKIGPMVKAQVIRNCPVDTGSLSASTTQEVDRIKHVLYIIGYGDESRVEPERKYYAAWVDLGHRIVVFGHDTGRVQPPTAYMRRALYKSYPGF